MKKPPKIRFTSERRFCSNLYRAGAIRMRDSYTFPNFIEYTAIPNRTATSWAVLKADAAEAMLVEPMIASPAAFPRSRL
ncbi:MAG: hypothetical protein ACOX15_06850 [Tepidanaerobacteraceae bacterium]